MSASIFCFFRDDAGPFGLTVRGFRGFFSFGVSLGLIGVSASASFFLRGLRAAFVGTGVVVADVCLALAFVSAACAEFEDKTPSVFRDSNCGIATAMVSAAKPLPFVCGEGTGESDDPELSSAR